MNVTGVDWSGLEWTRVDWSGHFFWKKALDRFSLTEGKEENEGHEGGTKALTDKEGRREGITPNWGSVTGLRATNNGRVEISVPMTVQGRFFRLR